MAELILGPIVGGLNSSQANLWGKADGPGTLYGWLGFSPDLSDAQLAGKSLPLSSADGFAGVAPLTGLMPDTGYHYALTLDDTPPGPEQAPYPGFTTFPGDGERRSFAFAFGSCFLPGDASGGTIFPYLEDRRKQDNLRFILMIGDQIYADAFDRNGIGKVACTLDEYRAVYLYTWSRPYFRKLLRNLPVFMTLDDHEVDDDWRWLDVNRRWATIPWWDMLIRWLQGRPPQERHLPRQRVTDALQAYWEHQAMHAPPMIDPPVLERGQYDLDTSGALAYSFVYGAAAFFVLDTRTQRVRSRQVKSMLGPEQWHALEHWLLKVKDIYPVKFLVSSSSLLYYLWNDFMRDRWSGFSQERDRLLHFLAANGIEGVYVLAGDLHAAHAVRTELYGPQGSSLPLWEFCATPFEQKPNRQAKFFYAPLRGGPIKRQERIFGVEAWNFGVVRVDFDVEKPRVRFEVYGPHGELLGQAQEGSG